MASPVEMIIWLAIIVVFGFFVCSRGLQKGIEKVSKVMMLAFACADYHSCNQQYDAFKCGRRPEFLPCSRFWKG